MPAAHLPTPLSRRRRPLRLPAAFVCAAAALAGCSSFDRDGTDQVSVFDLAPGDCIRAPEDVTVELTDLAQVSCDQPHELEVYAGVEYPESTAATADAGSTFPGDAALKDFADGTCAEEFAAYVGVDYRDSRLYFTYLVPSARSWEAEDDRSVICLVTTTGEELTESVADTGW